MRVRSFFYAVLICLVSGNSRAAESDLLFYQQVDQRVTPYSLPIDGEMSVFESNSGREYRFDASARVSGGVASLMRSALDYERYPEMGMPHLEATRIVARANSDVPGHGEELKALWVWNQMSYAGFQTSYYLEVEKLSSSAIVWRRVAKRQEWPFHERVILDRLSGSFYVEPLPDGSIYVRYVMVVRPQPWIPGVLIDQFIRTQSVSGIRKVIRALVADQNISSLFDGFPSSI